MADTVLLVREALATLPATSRSTADALTPILDEIDILLARGQASDVLLPTLMRLAAKAARDFPPANGEDPPSDLVAWIEALRKCVVEHDRDRIQLGAEQDALDRRLEALPEGD